MRMLRAAWVALAVVVPLGGAELIPLRWAWKDAKPLSLLKDTPVNCVLLDPDQTAIAEAAAAQGLTPLAVGRPGGGAFRGVVLEGDFPSGTAKPTGLVIRLQSRARLFAEAPATGVTGTAEGLWPGIQITANGAAKAGPSGTPWIDTNGGFLRSMRARSGATLWLANPPPKGMVLKVERYLQAIADAAMNGGRWVLSLDDDFARRLAAGDAAAVADWRRMMRHVAFFEERREWRSFEAASKLAIVQDPADGPVLAAGVLDMISTRHTPARAVAEDRLSAGSFQGAAFAVAVNPERLTAEQQALLKAFTRAGGTLLTGPTGWRAGRLEKQESDRLNDIWHEVQSMIGRRNMGARLFNVSSMLSNVLGDGTGRRMVVYLLNYSNYPVENVTVQLTDRYKRATLYTPEAAPVSLELYGTEEGTGVDIEKVGVFAAVYLES